MKKLHLVGFNGRCPCHQKNDFLSVYLGKKRPHLAREYSENYKKLRNIIEKTTDLNILLLKKNYAVTRR